MSESNFQTLTNGSFAKFTRGFIHFLLNETYTFSQWPEDVSIPYQIRSGTNTDELGQYDWIILEDVRSGDEYRITESQYLNAVQVSKVNPLERISIAEVVADYSNNESTEENEMDDIEEEILEVMETL